MTNTNSLYADVSAYINRTGISRRAFGLMAAGDPNFVFDLGKGRRCWPETEEKIRGFMVGEVEAHQ